MSIWGEVLKQMILPYWQCRGCDFASNILLTDSSDICSAATDLEYQLGALTMQGISLKHGLSSLGQAININALNNWKASFNRYLTGLQTGSDVNTINVPSSRAAGCTWSAVHLRV